MMSPVAAMTGIHEAPPRVSEWKRFRRVFFSRGVVVFGMVVIIFMTLVAMVGPAMAPYDPYETNLRSALQGPTAAHWFGTDYVGRDTFTRIIYGARTSLRIGLSVVFFASIVGMALGSIAGYYGGWTYTIIMRFIDAMMSFPMLLMALVIAALLGGGERNVIIALSISLTPTYARLMCGQVLSVKEHDYVLAAKSIGASDLRIIVRHVFVNCLAPLIVLMTMQLGSAILSEASLSFLGIGIQSPTAAWGSMVNDGRDYMLKQPILTVAPGLAIMLLVFAFNMVGDGLRDALDPGLRGRL
jgi:peptide/nickel transport system permease protein/oligopeptide transport system permease protein